MMYQDYSQLSDPDDELEPRSTPKKALQFNNVPAPSVPEVSIISDRPVNVEQSTEFKASKSPSIETYESYAAWRNKQFSASQEADATSNSNGSSGKRIPDNNFKSNISYSQHKSFNVHRSQRYENGERDDSKERLESKSPSLLSRISAHQTHLEHASNSTTGSMEHSRNSSQRQVCLGKKPNENVTKSSSGQSPIYSMNTSLPNENCELVQRHVCPTSHPMYPMYVPEAFPHSHHHQKQQQVCCSSQWNNESSETVKNLLMLINNQGEQIKCLQAQIDRLLRLHEDTLKEKQQCMHCRNTSRFMDSKEDRSEHRRSNLPSEDLIRNMESMHVSSKKNQEPEGVAVLPQIRKGDRIQDENIKQTILEQKVSIGVMTSFEFTVQNNSNNPFVTETEKHKDNDKEDVFRNKLGVTPQARSADQMEIQRKKQILSAMRSSGLENITEDSESHLSSSQPRSSNLHNRTHSPRHTPDEFIGTREVAQQMACGRTSDDGDDARRLMSRNINRYDRISESSFPIMNSHTNKRLYDERKFEDRDGNAKHTNEEFNYRTNVNGPRRNNDVEESIVLNGDDLKVSDRAPSPEPSIHVEMQEYSSDESSSPPKRTPNVGWTFYNNVIGQVNEILQNTPVSEGAANEQPKTRTKLRPKEKASGKPMDPVKAATFDQLAKMGISFHDNQEEDATRNQRLNFDTSYYPRLDSEMNMAHGTSTMTETNTSMRMKALAMKYLNKEQLSDMGIQKQKTEAVQHLMMSNMDGTNLSFATMRYLQRYQLLPGNQAEVNYQVGAGVAEKEVERDNVRIFRVTSQKEMQAGNVDPRANPQGATSSSPKTYPSKILDMTTLKQQPKLL